MEQIYSNIDNTVLLLSLIRFSEITKDRVNLSPDTEILQASVKKLTKGKNFKAHRHNKLERTTSTTQEGWVFLQGSVHAKFYDLDNTLILDTILSAGDCVVVFYAGHGFKVLEEDTIIYNLKMDHIMELMLIKNLLKKTNEKITFRVWQ